MIACGFIRSRRRPSVRSSGSCCGFVAVLVAVAAVLAPAAAVAQTPVPTNGTELGHVPSHGTFSQFPWESIDTRSGNIVLSFADLVLSGEAGFRLAIQRTWNANVTPAGWRWGVGPTLHIAAGEADPDPTALTLPDGLTLRLIPTGQPGVYMTDRQFWRVTISEFEHKAELPDGSVWYFQYGSGNEWVSERMVDPYGNEVEVVRDSLQRIDHVIQHLGEQTRVVEFEYWDGATPGFLLKSISYGGRTWQYVWPSGVDHLTVIPPEGPTWQFTPAFSQVWEPRDNGQEWRRSNWQGTVTLPSGGWVRYESSGYTYCGVYTYPDRPPEERPCDFAEAFRLRQRTIGGPRLTPASWSFSYELFYWDGIQHHEYRTAILAPDSLTRHIHGEATGEPLKEVAVENLNGDVIERKRLTWELVRKWQGDTVPGSGWYRDSVPTSVETTRDGRVYRREFEYDDDTAIGSIGHFGQPVQIVETGDFARTTTVAYQAFTGSRWLADAVSQVTVDGIVTAAAEYDGDTGFATSRTAFGVTTTFVPDAWGNVLHQTDANGHRTSFEYLWGAVRAIHTPEHSTTFTIKPFGETTAATRRGFTTEFTYDGLGRQTRVHPPVGNDTVTIYAPDASWVKVARGASWTHTDLDGFGRAVGSVNSLAINTLTTYNALGQVVYSSGPFSGPQHTGTQFTYDALGRVLTRTNPDSSVVHYAYDAAADGLLTTITDEEGRQTQQIWQASGSPDGGRLARVVDAAGHVTSYGYTALGSLTEVLSPGGVTRSWTYSAQNRLVSQTQPESGTVTYTYDAVGNLASQTDAKAKTTSYTYDGNNRLTQVTSWDPAYTTNFVYDASNNRTSVSHGYVTSTFEYDAANRLRGRTDVVRKTGQGDGRSFVSTYTPDNNGNVVEIRYPSGNAVQYRYDSENRATDVFDVARGETFAGAITYHPTGGVAGFTGGDGSLQTIAYDDRARPRRLAGQGVTNLLDLTYTYDRVGNVTRIDDVRLAPGTSQPTTAYTALFGYDALDRLTSAEGGGWGTLTYGYDPLGNRTQKTHNGATTGSQYTAQRLTGTTGTEVASFGYDPIGNLTQDAIGTYTYGPSNMLATATLNAGALSTYRYDGDGQRVTKQLGAGTTSYYLRGLGQVLSEFEEEGTQARWTVDYVYLGARLLAAVRPVTGTVTLTLGLLGAGAGTVASSPSGTSCGTDCQTFATGTLVTLTATPGAGLLFAGWSGDADCADGVVTLGRPTACYATFAPALPLFRKLAPAPFSSGASRSVRLEWTAASGASYLVCWDTTNNEACDTGWVPAGGLTSHLIDALNSGTYYWQVKTAGDEVAADAGTWWRFTVAVPAVPPDHWTAEYFANATLALPAVRTEDEGAGFLRHDWGSGSPAGLPAGDWSARYTRTITLTAPTRVRFFVLTDDGARLWVDGALVIDAWRAMPGPTIFTTVQDLEAGSHTLRLEYFNGDGPATLWLAWQDMATAILGPAEALRPGDVKASADGQYTVTYQADANLVVRRQNGAVAWATETAGTGTALQVALQYDGNLVLYVDDWAPVWDTGTAGLPGAWLALADDALTLRSPEGDMLWTVPLGMPLLTKTTPAAGATVTGSAVTFAWTAVAGESYRVCWDTTNNGTCNGAWVDAGSATSYTATAVTPGTYYWQVKTETGAVEADHGAWRALTVVAAPSFAKQAPTTGTTGLGSPVTLQWSALPEEGYYVCWDTTNNHTCDTTWWPNAAATTRALTALPVGTYHWQVKTIGGLEADGGTWWNFTVTIPTVPADHWKAEYFGNQNLSGAPIAVVDEGTGFVDHSWGDGGPAGLADHFSARFTRTVTLAAGRYRFTVTTDDGSRLWVNEQLRINEWWAQAPTPYTVEIDLEAGTHTLRYEYFEQTGGATAQLTWALLTPVVLASGESLGENQTRVSLDGAYRLQYQGDGNLVVVRLADDSCAWSSQTNGTTVGATIMQGDGNLVVYNGDWTGIWSTGTWGHDGARLEIANHTMAIISPDGTTRWSMSLAAAPTRPAVTAGTTPGTAGFLLVVAALFALAARAVRRWWFAAQPNARLRLSVCGGQAAGWRPQAARRLRARLSATALLLAAMLLVPARALAQIPTQVVEYYHTDALGSVRAVTKQVNGQWQVVARHDYLPFGEEVAPPGPPQEKRLFTGKERDHETGLDYFEVRYLGGGLGRFSTIDPLMAIEKNLVDPQQWNRYAYVKNNPLAFIDPTGAEIELLADSRDEAFAFFRDEFLLGDTVAASMLELEEVKRGGKTRYLLTVKKGKSAAFMQRSAAANWLGDLMRRPEVVEFGFTTADLTRWGGARTLDPAEHGVDQPRVLINRRQVEAVNETSGFYRAVFGGRVARDFTDEIVAAHELGHVWALFHGRGPVSSASSNAEAVYWENRMREWYYKEPLGPGNPQRLRHGIWR